MTAPTPQVPESQGVRDTGEQLRRLLFQGDEEPGVASAAVDDLVTSLMGPTARVVLPRDEDMVLKLVSVQALQRMDDARKTGRTYWTVMTTALGSLVGFMTNVVTSTTELHGQGWAFSGLLLVLTVVFGALGLSASSHEKKLVKELLDE